MNETVLAEFIGSMREAGSLDELRESMKNFGWVKEFPALRDEHGVVLVGNRRMTVAKELGIEPVVKDMRFGSGTAADAERVKLALVSNIGARPFQPNERQSIAKHLYGERQWTMQRIADALNVNQATVSRDLDNLCTVHKSKPTKTDTNPKGAGRPKGSKKQVLPKQTDRHRRMIELRDAGQSPADIAAEIGITERQVHQILLRERVKRASEDAIDPETLAPSAQERLAAAVRSHQRKLDIAFEQRVLDEVRRRIDEIVLPHWKQQIDEAKRIYEQRKGIMDKATFNKVRRGLHPDSRNSISDKVLGDAFDAFMRLEKLLLDEKDSPTDIARVPSTLAEWEAMKQKASAERRAKRNHKSNISQRH